MTRRATQAAPHRSLPQQAGFTLIEIMVVIVILGLLATIVVPNVIGMGDEARRQIAETNAKGIYDAAKLFRTRNGRPPTLEELLRPDDKGAPYLSPETETRDPWDNEYVIRETERGMFEVLSFGQDRSEGTEDDIVVGRAKDR